jgi:hypothetical protein
MLLEGKERIIATVVVFVLGLGILLAIANLYRQGDLGLATSSTVKHAVDPKK